MSNLQEVPTDELLSFQDYPTVHTVGNNTTIPVTDTSHIRVNDLSGNFENSSNMQGSGDAPNLAENTDSIPMKSFWSIEYYQKFFDVDTKEVVERIIASITPKWDNSLKHHLRTKPDLYGPFWISVTLIFTLAIGGNIANYLHHANAQYHWKYDFHLVSYAATIICLYVTLVPFILWGLLKWSSQVNDIEGLEENITPGVLELICIYGYSLFIYIPASILWSIQINLLQWLLVLIATLVSGSVLILTIMPALRLSRHKFLITVGIISCHLLLAVGFMLYYFHAPTGTIIAQETHNVTSLVVDKAVIALSQITPLAQSANKTHTN